MIKKKYNLFTNIIEVFKNLYEFLYFLNIPNKISNKIFSELMKIVDLLFLIIISK